MCYHQILTIIKNHLKLNPSLLLSQFSASRIKTGEMGDARVTSGDIKNLNTQKFHSISSATVDVVKESKGANKKLIFLLFSLCLIKFYWIALAFSRSLPFIGSPPNHQKQMMNFFPFRSRGFANEALKIQSDPPTNEKFIIEMKTRAPRKGIKIKQFEMRSKKKAIANDKQRKRMKKMLKCFIRFASSKHSFHT